MPRKITSKLKLDQVLEAAESGEDAGFCITCGEITYGVEPDARNYRCDACQADTVFGAEELVLMMC